MLGLYAHFVFSATIARSGSVPVGVAFCASLAGSVRVLPRDNSQREVVLFDQPQTLWRGARLKC